MKTRPHTPWFSITPRAAADLGDTAIEVMIYGFIGSNYDDDDVTAASFIRAFNAVD